jgi:hypothetical protein
VLIVHSDSDVSALFAAITVVEVGGRVDFPALVPIVEDLPAVNTGP